MADLYSKDDVVLINQFAASLMAPPGPHDTDAVLAERIQRAFRMARVMLIVSKEVAATQAPVAQRKRKEVKDGEVAASPKG